MIIKFWYIGNHGVKTKASECVWGGLKTVSFFLNILQPFYRNTS